ncbi:hypothetical protein TCDM_01967 [Trypanosoma cruzi Dm28c]|uniref:Uncharacterized protein n=1 Tax=Trypanosoma cruzi Dm28c TaxID=1416333 RepID=V5DP70_TRYCR|nr:hypothetical protein TCDM_01967 [Trypanosoma cruzi Dm28c]
MHKTSSPSKYGCNRVCTGFLPLLMLAVVTSHSPVRGLRLDGSTIRRHENRRHEPKRTKSLSNTVGLDVTIVVLASPYVTTLTFHDVSNHVINKAMLIPNASFLVFRLVGRFVHLRKNIFESTVVTFQNSVFRREIQWPFLGECVLKATLCEVFNAFIRVVHAHQNTTGFKIKHLLHLRRTTTFGDKVNFKRPRLVYNQVRRPVLIPKGMASNHNGMLPSCHQTWNVFAHDGFAKNCPAQNIPDCSVWTLPHLLQVELPYTSLVWCNRCTFHTHTVLFNGMCGVNSDLIVRFVTILHTKIIVLNGDIKNGKISSSLIIFQITRVISSPSSSTTVPATLIFCIIAFVCFSCKCKCTLPPCWFIPFPFFCICFSCVFPSLLGFPSCLPFLMYVQARINKNIFSTTRSTKR